MSVQSQIDTIVEIEVSKARTAFVNEQVERERRYTKWLKDFNRRLREVCNLPREEK